jgi:glycerol-3-phosphate dehydrogenase
MAAADTEDRPPVDIFVIGGGVNGCGIARDAAGRGFSVMLAEMGDLASGTSSAATKLVHGGLRYLEYYEFRLVREALTEREILWTAAPHIIKPLRFVLPYHEGLRPAFVLRSGLFLYDHLGGRKLLPPTRTVDLTRDEAGKPLKPGYRTGFEYSDCWVNDARLVVLCARDAADHGATILTRTKVTSARRADGLWAIEMTDVETGECSTVKAKFLVNAAGPWVDHVIVEALGQNGAHNVRLVKGSHIVVKRHYAHDRCYIFQNADNRIIFAIPYEGEFTLIGTTDIDYQDDPAKVAISDAEIDYLCAAASEYFREPVTPDEIVWSYSGVRPLFDDHASAAQEATRDYVLRLDHPAGAPGLLDVFGGKLTTHRRLAEDALEKIETVIGRRGKPWTKGAKLPGGDFAPTDFSGEVARTAARHLDLPRELIERLVRLYGTKTAVLLDGVEAAADLGEDFGAGLSAREVDYLVAHEWARTAEDILWRRTKLGLHGADRGKLENYLKKKAVGGS